MPAQRATIHDWVHLVVVVGARFYRTLLLALAAIALAPVLFSWGSFVVTSDSMRPAISVGDVVVGKPVADQDRVAVGRVYVFDDPAPSAARLMVHRVVELRDDGKYTTAGDANEVTDFIPITADDLVSRAVLLAPYIGLPVIWFNTSQWVKLGLWLLLTIAAFWVATRNLDGEPPKWTAFGMLRRALTRRRGRRTDRQTVEAREASPHRRHWLMAPLSATLMLAMLGGAVGSANAGFTARTSNGSNSWTAGHWVQDYVSEVLADRPYGFWLLDEPVGARNAADRSGNNTTGEYWARATLGRPGALPNNPGTSMRVGGGLAFSTSAAASADRTHSMELWFRTTSTDGGYLIGFGTSKATTASQDDRVLRMSPSGQLVYGDWDTNPVRLLTTPRSYNDGAWHHVVVSYSTENSFFQQASIHVDGVLMGDARTSKVRIPMTGYWRIGSGSGGPAFSGDIDNVALYRSRLSPERIAAHYASR